MNKLKKIRKEVKDFIENVVKGYAIENKHAKNGKPQITATVNGYYIAVTVSNKATDLQLYNKEMIRKANGIAVILTDEKQLPEFKLLLQYLQNNDINLAYQKQYRLDKGVIKN